jgi:hypothetical protein
MGQFLRSLGSPEKATIQRECIAAASHAYRLSPATNARSKRDSENNFSFACRGSHGSARTPYGWVEYSGAIARGTVIEISASGYRSRTLAMSGVSISVSPRSRWWASRTRRIFAGYLRGRLARAAIARATTSAWLMKRERVAMIVVMAIPRQRVRGGRRLPCGRACGKSVTRHDERAASAASRVRNVVSKQPSRPSASAPASSRATISAVSPLRAISGMAPASVVMHATPQNIA